MLRALPHVLGFALPAAMVGAVHLGGAWTFLPVALVLVFVPVADWLAGLDLTRPVAGEDDELERAPWFRAINWLWVPVHLALLVWCLERLEHYGLYRRELEPGRYKRVMPWHSWNSSHRLSNWLLINLARHADHHLVASKRYQLLEHAGDAPQLPAGYGAMLLAALCPPVWRGLIDPRLERWRKMHVEQNT